MKYPDEQPAPEFDSEAIGSQKMLQPPPDIIIMNSQMAVEYRQFSEDNTKVDEPVPNRLNKKIVLGVIVVSIVLYHLVREQNGTVVCMRDTFHNITYIFNRLINSNRSFADTFLTIGQLFVDINFFFLGYFLLRHAQTFEIPSWMVVFYATRAFFLSTLKFPFTQGHYWEAPPLPSILVPYGKSRDYFYSGHTGYMVFGALHFNKLGNHYLCLYNIVGLVFIIFELITTRVHYTIDIIMGFIVSITVFWFVNQHMEIFDRLWAMPLRLAKYCWQKINRS